jgi:D-alanyl-D-alanine carboxypeptidase
MLTTNNAEAKTKKLVHQNTSRHAALIMDSETGRILHQENSNKSRFPASLTKMMTLYLTFEALEKGLLDPAKKLKVSNYASHRPKSNIGLKEGGLISVRDAIMASIVKSANDATVVLAEAIGGSESNFARLMTEKARKLGMDHTFFRNASGLHHPEQITTAHDMAKLGLALKRDFPEYYHLFSQTSFIYKGTALHGHNHVLKNYPGATGLKTGFVNASGFNLVTSAARGNTKLIGVVMGGDTARSRDRKMTALLDRYFSQNEEVRQNASLTVPKTPNLAKSKSAKKNIARNKITKAGLTKSKKLIPAK